MQKKVLQQIEKRARQNRRWNVWQRIAAVLACVAVFCTAYALILPAITMENQTWCGREEHIHDESCYSVPQDGGEPVLICGKQEHCHSLACYSDPEADVETAAAWAATVPEALTGAAAQDLLNVAQSQLGYTESTRNYQVTDGGRMLGYSRYGAWAGAPYSPWRLHFVRFCMEYAQIPPAFTEGSQDANGWMAALRRQELLAEDGTELPLPGEVVFFQYEGALTAGVVASANAQVGITAIVGDCGDQVRTVTLGADSADVLGFMRLAQREMTEPAPTDPEKGTELPQSAASDPGENTPEHTEPSESAAPTETAAPTESTEPAEPVENTGEAWADLISYKDSTPEEKPALFMTMAVPKAGTPVDMTDMITEVILERNVNGKWEKVPPNGTVQVGDNLRFKIQYLVEPNTLSPNQNQITYTMPDSLKVLNDKSGVVQNNTGQKVGTYEITTDNKILITFYEQYARENADGKAINGGIYFNADINEIKVKPGENLEIGFNGQVNITVKVEENQSSAGDVQVTKTGTSVPAEGLVDYTVTVTSKYGTGGPVKLSDLMSGGILYEKGLTVTDKQGKPVKVEKVPSRGAEGFDLVLPRMKAGEKYTISYWGKLEKPVTGTTIVKNSVNVESTDSKGKVIQSKDMVENRFSIIEKHGKVKEDGTIDWTITINRSKQNIGGWTLEDRLNGKPYEGTVTITTPDEESIQVKLPYTFPRNSRDVYTITYTTSAKDLQGDLKPGKNQVVNEGILIDLDKQQHSGKHTGIVPYNPVHKTGNYTDNMDGTLTIHWTVSINTDFGKLPNKYITELLVQRKDLGTQYFTAAQLQAGRNAMEAELDKLKVKYQGWQYMLLGSGQTWTDWSGELDPKGQYAGFRVKSPLPKDAHFVLKFESTAIVPPDSGNTVRYVNTFSVYKETVKAPVDYKPTEVHVAKYDPAKGENGGNSSHDLHRLPNGELRWQVKVTFPRTAESTVVPAYTMTDVLPDGVTLTGLAIHTPRWDKNKPVAFDFKGGDRSEVHLSRDSTRTCKAVISPDGKVITLTVSDTLTKYISNYEQPYCYFDIHVKINDDFPWPQGELSTHQAEFTNQFFVKNPENTGEDLTWDQHTHQVTKHDSAGTLLKDGRQYTDNNLLDYTLHVNPEGKDLLTDGDELVLTDTLTYLSDPNSPKPIRVVPVPKSLKMYRRNPDGSKGELLPAPRYTAREVQVPDPAAAPLLRWNYELVIFVPDGMPLIVEYSYNVGGELGKRVNLTNQASLKGVTTESTEEKNEMDIVVKESGATADIRGITLFKVDKNNNGIYLPGAEFELYRWTGTEYVRVTKIDGTTRFVTDRDGQITIDPSNVSRDQLAYNTGYRLVEVKAPAGYYLNPHPFEFYVEHPNRQENPMNLPEGFTIHNRLVDGDVAYYEDERGTTEIRVTKKWKNADGTLVEKPNGSISFELWRGLASDPEAAESIGTYTLTAENGWTFRKSDLDRSAPGSGTGDGENYLYWVKEIRNPGYLVSYINNEGINEGTIVITNQQEAGYVLPETGGPGLWPLALGGALLILGSLILLRRRKRAR